MSVKKLSRSQSSFRDPSGHILTDSGGNVYRSVTEFGKQNFDFVENSGFYAAAIGAGQLIGFEKVKKDSFDVLGDGVGDDVAYVLAHEKVPFISYPYEWTFGQLQAAALLQLDLHLKALDHNVTLSDATAYNIQFIGSRPVFIDVLSFIKYEDGMLWKGQQQFVEQFLTPLLLTSYRGIPFNAWYRGTMTGIPAQDLHAVAPFLKKWSFGYLNYITLPCLFERKQVEQSRDKMKAVEGKLPKDGLVFILKQLRKWVASLKNPYKTATVWGDYTNFRSYSDDEVKQKLDYVTEKVALVKPGMVWDIGCNTGEFSLAALQAGAGAALGLELDHGALAGAYAQSVKERANFLPLYMDLTNPSPDSGWNERERSGLWARRRAADFIMALAVIHHMTIGGNVPLREALHYLVGLAPNGVIEWVPKTDGMIVKMLLNRDDIFFDYDEESFMAYIEEQATIKDVKQVSAEGRKLVFYQRN